jgi:methionine synthase I (cobalamin-dependent)
MNNPLAQLIKEKGVLLADGATGSNLFDAGLQTGDSPELWNDIHPDRIAKQYQTFIDAGSDIVLTNSFGGTRYRLKLHGAENRVEELNVKAAQIAKEQIADAQKDNAQKTNIQQGQADRTILIGGCIWETILRNNPHIPDII